MKIENLSNNKHTFEPIKFEVTLETQQEAMELLTRLNIEINEIRSNVDYMGEYFDYEAGDTSFDLFHLLDDELQERNLLEVNNE